MCMKGTKEHEAISRPMPRRRRSTAACSSPGPRQGNPVQFVPKFEPPAGTAIAIEVPWLQDGKVRSDRTPANGSGTRRPRLPSIDWVFAGSLFYEDLITKKTVMPPTRAT